MLSTQGLRYGSLPDMIRCQARQLGGRTAYIGPFRSWSYAELDAESNRVARALLTVGVHSGDGVACLSRHGIECTLLLLAAGKIGAVATPLNWRLAVPELDYVIGVTQPKVLLFDEFLRETLDRVSMPSVVQRLMTEGGTEFESLSSWSVEQENSDPGATPGLDDTALRLFSSGTTGRPKAIELSHRALLTQCAEWAGPFGYREHETRHLNTLPTFHVSGVVNALWMLHLSGSAVFLPQFEPSEYLATIARHRISDIFVVPAMLRALLDSPAMAGADLSSLKSIAYGGSPIDETLLEQCMARFGCGFLQVYGMTEAAGAITALAPADHDPKGSKRHLMTSVGKPAAHVALRVVDPVTGTDREAGEVGEVWIRSQQNMLGYFADAAATQATFPLGQDERGGWMRTGDAGYLENGYLYLRDRIKDMIISGGENIYSAEVEAALAAHSAVLEAAVIGVPHDKWGETVKACITLRPGNFTTEAELIAHARVRLAHYKCPTSVDFVAALPRNPSGKILKHQLREQYWKDRTPASGRPRVAPGAGVAASERK